ncbi:MAG: hypothetical protein IPN37_06575 [Betaproteobacteria bacterium]|nr:hypothetical protein [Betaproteobacteria bacterium]
MIAVGSLEYAHARIWARHGQRPGEALWRRIETTRDLAAVLELARGSALSCWLEGIGPAAGTHDIEQALRRHWRERVGEVATWMPPAWAAAIEWCTVLADLPVLQYLARGGASLPWMAADPRLRVLLDLGDAGDAGDRGKGGPPEVQALRSLLDTARGGRHDLLPLWCAEWHRRLPLGAASQGIDTQLVPLLAQHASAFAAPQAVDGWGLRRQLQSRLVLLLRRTLVEPLTAFVYLALSALECERLRGELVRRAAFPRGGLAP